MKFNLKTSTATAVVLVVGILGVSALNPEPASASAYLVKNNSKSVRSIDIYNHAGCAGKHVNVGIGKGSKTYHLWKTFWLPAKHKAKITSSSTSLYYTVSNTNSYAVCTKIGKVFDPFGYNIYLYR